jgi:hypothetical protein
MKRIGLLGVLMALVLTACGGGSVKSPDFEAQLKTLTVAPDPASVGTGETLQFTASGTYTTPPGQGDDNEIHDLTSDVHWTSSDPSVATIDENGVATGVGAGTTTITAEKDGIKKAVTLTGEGLVLRSLVITPTQKAVEPKGSATFTAQGKYSDGTVKDVTSSAISWTLDPATLGTISPATGKTVTITAGRQTGLGVVTASTSINGQDITGTAQFIVGQIVALRIEPATATSPNGEPYTGADGMGFRAVGTFASPTGADPFDSDVAVNWTAANKEATAGDAPSLQADGCASKATTTCVVTGHAEGDVLVTATPADADVDPATATLTVTPGILKRVDITTTAPNTAPIETPSTIPLPLDGAQQLYALYHYSDVAVPVYGPRTASEAVTWASSAPATVEATPAADNSIIANPLKQGTADITASVGALSDKVTINVGVPAIKSITRIEPSIAYVQQGKKASFVAYGIDTTTNAERIAKVTWSSANTGIALIDPATGVATAIGAVGQETRITATLKADPSKTATAGLSIRPDSCITPLLAADGATSVEGPKAGICLLCAVTDPEYVINADPTDAGVIRVGVGLLNAFRSIDVTASPDASYGASYVDGKFVAGSRPAFVIRNPTGPLVLAEVASQIEMSTLLNGAQQESTSDLTPLRLDLLGAGLIDGKSDGIVSFATKLPYNGIRIKLRSGLATALSTVEVAQACATSQPPPQLASGIGKLGVAGVRDAATPTIEAGATVAFVAYDYADPTQQLNADDVTWTSLDAGVATVSATGVVTGVAAGTTKIRASLKDQSQCGSHCTFIRDIKVTPAICEAALLASSTATIGADTSGLCIGCSARDLPNVIDANPQTYGSVFLPVDLLGGAVTVTATAKPPYALPFKGGATVGFVVASPSSALLTAEIGSQIIVRTLHNGAATGDASNTTNTPLRLDLLGITVAPSTGVDARPLYITTSKDFDAVQITFNGGLATLLSRYDLYTACIKGPQ